MEQEFYGEEAANFICQLTGWSDALEIRDKGVFVKDGYLANDPGEQAFTWTPACEMDWHGAPDPLTAPALPIPFTASDLASFILDGAGYGIQSRFGWIECGLDEGELERLSIRTTKVRKALKEAYSLAQRAQCVAGADNHEEQQRAADLLSAYSDARSEALARENVMERLKVRTGKDGELEYGDFEIPRDEYLRRLNRVKEAVDVQKADAERAASEAETRHRKWRKAMVHQLLAVGKVPPAQAVVTESEPMMPAPDTQAGQVAPAVELSNGDGSASVFLEMADLTASELTLAFVGEKPESGLGANNMLEVTARGQKRRIALASLDLVDKRKGTPNGECGVLLGLAQGLNPKKSNANTQKMKRLRSVFLHHFGIDKDPFEPYMAATGWVPLFKIVDRRGAADERAKKEAEERMVSLQQLEEQGVQLRDRSNNDADYWMKEHGHRF
jgi:hypothetical protein